MLYLYSILYTILHFIVIFLLHLLYLFTVKVIRITAAMTYKYLRMIQSK